MLNSNPRITAAGLALFTNQAPGFSVTVTHIALGTSNYAPVGDEVALKSEFARFAVESGADVSPSTIQVGALIKNVDAQARSTSNKYIGEIGFYVGQVLLAVLSQAGRALFYKSPDLDVPISYLLDFSTLPPGSLTVGQPEISESLRLAAQTAQAQAVIARNATNEAKTIKEAVTADVSGYVSNYQSLREYAGPVKRIFVTGVVGTSKPQGIGGDFVLDASDSTSADNGGTVIVGIGNKRWKRVYSGMVDVKWFGAIGDGIHDDVLPIQAALDSEAAVTYLTEGMYKITAPLKIYYGKSMRGDGGVASQLLCADCDGLRFMTYGYQIGSMFYEDFGITAISGLNRTAVVTLPNATTMDGLNFDRIRFYGWNECFSLAANWKTTIHTCMAQKVNCFIATSGEVVGVRALHNHAVCDGGGFGSAVKAAFDVRGGTIQEAIFIETNYFYGFDYSVKSNGVSFFVNILGNDLNALIEVISYTTVNGILNIKDNLIETFGKGIVGKPQSVQTPTTQAIIKDNTFRGVGENPTVGLELNADNGTYQFNTIAEDNVFVGFKTHDIRAYSPGRTFLNRNRCMSDLPTHSVWMGQVIAGPVELTKNWLKKGVHYDNPSDIATGLLVVAHAAVNDTFVPVPQ